MTLPVVKNIFEQEFGNSYRQFAAPGRINLIGEHTDYNNGYVLPASIDKKIYLAIEPCLSNQISIISTDYNEKIELSTQHYTTHNLPQWAKYPLGVVMELENLGIQVNGFNAVFGGDIPLGAGLSSSAALESAFAVAFNDLFNLKLDKLALAKIGQNAENNHVGVRCGIMDQFASIFGKSGHVVLLDCCSLNYQYFPMYLSNYTLILCDTQVKHSLASTEYNKRRAECEEGVSTLTSVGKKNITSLRDVTIEMLEANRDKLAKNVFLRCQYVIEENNRVLKTCQALTKKDFETVGKLMFESHQGLQHKYNVSCEELDCLVEEARTINGVVGARMMGGGFGGCTINLLKKEKASAFKKQLGETYYMRFSRTPAFYDIHITSGADEIKPTSTN
jgi:galactokinase